MIGIRIWGILQYSHKDLCCWDVNIRIRKNLKTSNGPSNQTGPLETKSLEQQSLGRREPSGLFRVSTLPVLMMQILHFLKDPNYGNYGIISYYG